jgi:outer membrane protein TolC
VVWRWYDSRMRRFHRCIAIVAAVFATIFIAPPSRAGETLTLEQAIGRALEVAPTLANATASSDLSRAQVDEARAPLLPDIGAAGDYSQSPGYNEVVTNGGQTLAQLVLGYTAYDGGRRSDRVRAARYASEAAMLGVAAVRAQIVFDATVAYYDLVRARGQQSHLSTNLGRLGGYVAIVEALERSGRAIPNDVLRIRSARDSARLALATARQAVEHASIVLASLIGADDADHLQVETINDLPAMPSAELERSPAYMAAARQVSAAAMLVAAARDERYPTVKIALTAGWLGVNPPKTFGHDLGASYDTAVAVPIFQGGLVRSHIDEALATQHAAEAQRRQVKLELARDLADANDRYVNARQQLDLVEQSHATADDSFALDWTRFLGGGNVSILEVIDAFQQAEALRLTRLDQEFAARQAAAQASLVLGIAQ